MPPLPTCDVISDCQGGPAPPTDDGVDCTEDSCDEVNDIVVNAANDLLCDDQDPCTAESCDEILGCTSEPVESCTIEPVPALHSSERLVLALAMLAIAAALIGARRPRRV